MEDGNPALLIINGYCHHRIDLAGQSDSHLRVAPNDLDPTFAARPWHFCKAVRVNVQDTVDVETVNP